MLTTVKLHGHLQEFGTTYEVNARSIREVLSFLNANFPGFSQCLLTHNQPGYFVVLDDQDLPLEMLGCNPSGHTVHLIPALQAAGGDEHPWHNVLMGAALVGLAFVTGGAAGTALLGKSAGYLASAMFGTGASMILGGLTMLLSPQQQAQPEADKVQSYIFDGGSNIDTQGGPVPIVYGRARIGSVVASFGVTTETSTDGNNYIPEGFYITEPKETNTFFTEGDPVPLSVTVTSVNGTGAVSYALTADSDPVFSLVGDSLTATLPARDEKVVGIVATDSASQTTTKIALYRTLRSTTTVPEEV